MGLQHEETVATPPYSVARFICEGYAEDPFKQMVVGVNEGITYAEAYRRMMALAGYLQSECQVGEGDAVMVAAPNIVSYFALVGAVQLAGANVALMSPTVERAEFQGIYDRVRPKAALVSTAAHCAFAAECSPQTKVMTVGCEVEGVPSVEGAWRSSAPWSTPHYGDDPIFVLFTSGSTGTPKAVQLRGSAFCRHAGELVPALKIRKGEVFFIPVPFAHVYGVVAMHAALSMHATVATMVKYRPETALSLISSTRASVYMGVSTMYLRELRENQDGEWDISCLRAGLVAGATSPLAVFEEYQQRYGAILVNSYGMTETASPALLFPLDSPTSVFAGATGKPVPGVDARIVDERGHEVPWGETGELLLRGACVTAGYFRHDNGEIEPDGWLHTGDVAYANEEGMVWVVDRLKDMINRGGEKVWCSALEEVLCEVSGVSESCVAGIPDELYGEVPVAAIVRDPGSDITGPQISEALAGRIAHFKIPVHYVFVDKIPQTRGDKPNRAAVRDAVLATLGHES